MSRQITVYVTLFLSILLFGCTSREAPAPVSSLDNKVKPATRKVNISGSKYVVKRAILYIQLLLVLSKIFEPSQK